MDQVTIVEVRDAQGVTRSRVRVQGTRMTLGRGPDNSVVVDDEYVDAEHLEISVSDGNSFARVRDVGTTNGTRIDGTVLRGAEAEVPFGTPVRVGNSTVLFGSPTTPVSPARLLLEPDRDRLLPYHRLPAWTLTLLLVVYLTAVLEWQSYDRMKPEAILGTALVALLLVIGWAGMWAVGSRILTGAGRFREHLGFVSLFGLVVMPVLAVVDWVTFAVGDTRVELVSTWGLAGFVPYGVSLFGHLDIASRRRRRAKVNLAAGIATGLLVLSALFARLESSPALQIRRSLRTLRPVPVALTRSTSLDTFLKQVETLEAEVNRDAEKSRAEAEKRALRRAAP